MTILYILAALLMLGVMILIHEAGHFFAARATGIPVSEFAIGFGPKIKSWKSKKHETVFSIRAIPAGGFCAFYGEDDPNADDQHDARALRNFPVWKRVITIVMGPVMNFVLAFVVCFAYVMGVGFVEADYGRPHIIEVTEDSPAGRAGLMADDFIESINGISAAGLDENGNYRMNALIDGFKSGDPALQVVVTRGDEQQTILVAPEYNDEYGRFMIGITMQIETLNERKITPSIGEGISYAFDLCVTEGTQILDSLRQLVTGKVGLDQASGPVGVVQIVVEQTREYGFEAYLSLLIFISVNLGLVNLLPIPGLDGSRLIFLIIEGIRRKPVPQKVEAYINLAGLALLMILFVFLTCQDVGRLF